MITEPLEPISAGEAGVSVAIVTLLPMVTLFVPKMAVGNAGAEVSASTRSWKRALTPCRVPIAVTQRWTTFSFGLTTYGPTHLSVGPRVPEVQYVKFAPLPKPWLTSGPSGAQSLDVGAPDPPTAAWFGVGQCVPSGW